MTYIINDLESILSGESPLDGRYEYTFMNEAFIIRFDGDLFTINYAGIRLLIIHSFNGEYQIQQQLFSTEPAQIKIAALGLLVAVDLVELIEG